MLLAMIIISSKSGAVSLNASADVTFHSNANANAISIAQASAIAIETPLKLRFCSRRPPIPQDRPRHLQDASKMPSYAPKTPQNASKRHYERKL